MKRTFNYTGRRRIDRQRVAVALESGTPATGRIHLNLDGIELPTAAEVFLEAYRPLTYFQRWRLGTVGTGTLMREFSLDGLDDPKHVRFRVKVVADSADQPRLVAVADKVIAAFPAEQAGPAERTLLDPVFVDFLGEEVWRVDFDYAEEPVLLVNNQVFGIREAVASDAVFAGLVYPAVLRSILSAAVELVLQDDEDDDEQPGWADDWAEFARVLGGGPCPDEASEADIAGWVNEAVALLARKISAAAKYSNALRMPA